ncbi:hypothetical protein BDD26_0556 [Xenorhabdus cabanillasii]|uniref:Uncharacterized protein n=1 Tax=Xenorhabdus cabanillasii TaxID=351673 RepID=A0A3D9U964_9GAMM|nr:hypothetical protein BDD26_0556 [Xenorhabdus cabanillasii]
MSNPLCSLTNYFVKQNLGAYLLRNDIYLRFRNPLFNSLFGRILSRKFGITQPKERRIFKMTININSDISDKCPWQTRIDYLSQKIFALQQRLRYMELSRFIVFISLLGLVYHLWQQSERELYLWLTVTGGVSLFVALVFLHHHMQEQ